MKKLTDKKCVACESENMAPMNKSEAETFLMEVEGWTMDAKGKLISKEFEFKNFDKAMDFVNVVADIAELENHHPDIYISYSNVKITLSTHSIKGLSENDFIVAAKINAINL